MRIFQLQAELDEQFQDIKLWNQNTCCLFPSKDESEEVPKKIWKWNLQRSTDLNQSFFDSKLQDFYSHLPKEKNFSPHEFQIQNDSDVLQQIYNS